MTVTITRPLPSQFRQKKFASLVVKKIEGPAALPEIDVETPDSQAGPLNEIPAPEEDAECAPVPAKAASSLLRVVNPSSSTSIAIADAEDSPDFEPSCVFVSLESR